MPSTPIRASWSLATRTTPVRNPYPRLTLTFSGIARSRLVIFTVAGETKRQALRAVMDGADLPANRVTSDRVLWVVDRAAAPS